jgi:putative membrane protein
VTGDTAADRHVHPATVPLRFLKEAPSTLLGLPAALAYVSDVEWKAVLTFAAVAAVILILVNWILWKRFRYGVGASEIVIESGLLHRTRRSIPFARIQDLDIERGPLQRLFGLAKVKIETGGSGKDEGTLDSVSLVEADRVRAVIRAGRAAGQVAEEESRPAPEGRTIFRMDLQRVLLLGLFSFSLLYIAGIFAVLQSFADFLPFDIYDPGRWMGLVDEQRANRFFAPGAVIAVLFLALLLGVITGVLRTIARDYGFRLTVEEGARFRRERGLFTRTEVVVQKKRIQLGLVRTGPLRRRFGGHALYFQTLSAGKEGGGQQVVAPFAAPGELEPILAEEGRLRMVDPEALELVSKRHVLRIILIDLLPLPVILIASLFWPSALLFLLLFPLPIALGLVERHFHRFALADDLLFVSKGWWRRRLWMIPPGRIQSLRISRGFIQRRLGLATLSIDTAGAPALDPPRIVDISEERARSLAAALLARQDSGRKSGTER